MFKKNKIFLILILAFILRTLFLNLYPNNLTNDELHFVLNSKSVFYQFSDLAKQWNPLSLTTIPQESSSELPFILTTLGVGILPLGLFTSKLIFVIFGVGSIYLLYLIAKKLFSENIALLSSLIFTINPWSIYVHRTAFDAPLAIFFYLLTLYLLLILKKQKTLLAFIPALLAFYCYIGTKVIFLPIIFVYLLFAFFNNKKDKKYYIIVFLLSIFLLFFYYFRIGDGSKRISELVTPFNQEIIDQSLLERNQSFISPFRYIFSNKYAVFTNNFIIKYLGNFDPNILFLKGDQTYLVSLWHHGYFYLIDFAFIILGIIGLYKHKLNLFYFIIGLIALSPIPEAIRIDKIPAYAFHSCFQYPFFCILIAFGILEFQKLKIPYNRTIIYFLYIISFIFFLNIYFFRYPIYQSEGFFFGRRLVSNYIRLSPNKKIIVISPEPDSLFRTHLFNNNLFKKTNIKEISSQYQKQDRNNFIYQNIIFTKQIPETFDKNTIYIIDKQSNFTPPQNVLVINKLNDPANLFYILNDTLCNSYKLDNYVHDLHFSDLNINRLDPSQFCQKYINFKL